jgi:glutamyl-tRNA synthetase
MRRKQKPRYDGRCRARTEPRPGVEPVVRFRNPDHGTVLVDDLVRGKVVFDNAELDDLIIARADGTPTYNFTVVVDDMDMRITHVIRGDDHLNNTPRQINIFRALGAEPPRYAHVPMILGADGKKLSKRHGALSVLQYREEGYLPQALLNYLVRLGWSHGDQEIFTIEEMIELFDIADVNPSASTFNPDKLLWVNQQHLKMADFADVEADLRFQFERQGIDVSAGPDLRRLFDVQKQRTRTLAELVAQSRTFFEDFDAFDPAAARKHLRPAALEGLRRLRAALAAQRDWSAPALHEVVVSVAESLGLKLGKLAQPLRVAVTGGAVSPSIDATLELLGKARTLERLDRAIAFVEARAETAG